ncbi:cytochrome c peroxidase [Methylotuvimicrobium sp. KM2]|uniref:cytochrome-c peroxidase n=1 Tax=Methylotuvimicrobium sp. KM2 TaxID=3133976 RepID=UPI003100F3DF
MFISVKKAFVRQFVLSLCLLTVLLGHPKWALAHGFAEDHSFDLVTLPETPGLVGKRSSIVVDQEAAIQLGKALFWDINVGSDGIACASCHFHAGADRRTRNQMNSGQRHTEDTESAKRFDIGGPDYELKASDFPFFRLSDPADKNSEILFATDDVAGSSGAFKRSFESVQETGDGIDQCTPQNSDIFHANGLNTRQVTNRNTPTVINAAFNFRNFWDGRANNIFNGVSGFGLRDPDAKVWIARNGKRARQVKLYLEHASLASQAVEPPLDMIETSCQGRTFSEIGKKLIQRRPLETQQIHAEDSVLGGLRHDSGKGLNTTYGELIEKAFHRRFWRGTADFGVSNSGEPYSQIEANFAFFFGLAIQLYENTLISDQAPFDQPLDDAGYPSGFNAQQKQGQDVFFDAHCHNCHSGPTFSAAINPQAYFRPGKKPRYYRLVDRTVLGQQTSGVGIDKTLVDIGFFNTSVTPNDYDVGLGGKDPFGNPLSFAEQYLAVLANDSKAMVDPIRAVACDFVEPFVSDLEFGDRETIRDRRFGRGAVCRGKALRQLSRVPSPDVVEAEMRKPGNGRVSTLTTGAFKVPTLRNVELTGPYMHNGGMKSLEEVVEFYNRGGNIQNRRHAATLVFDQGFTEEDKASLVAFMKTLTDERVRWEKAPFDHPELWVPHGHEEGISSPIDSSLAEDKFIYLPPVGRNGRTNDQGPLKPFDSFLQP